MKQKYFATAITLLLHIRIYNTLTEGVYKFLYTSSICEKIYHKGSYTCTVSGRPFHNHSTDTTIDQQFMLVPLPKLQLSAFTEALFTGLSGIHGCLGGL